MADSQDPSNVVAQAQLEGVVVWGTVHRATAAPIDASNTLLVPEIRTILDCDARE